MASEKLSHVGTEKGWRFAVPCPDKCGPGLMPYPIIIEGPQTQGKYTGVGMSYEQVTVILLSLRVQKGANTTGQCFIIEQYPVVGKGYGPIHTGKLVLEDIKAPELAGSYQLRTSYDVYYSNSELVRHIVVESKPFEVEANFDNSNIHLGQNSKCLSLCLMLMSHAQMIPR